MLAGVWGILVLLAPPTATRRRSEVIINSVPAYPETSQSSAAHHLSSSSTRLTSVFFDTLPTSTLRIETRAVRPFFFSSRVTFSIIRSSSPREPFGNPDHGPQPACVCIAPNQQLPHHEFWEARLFRWGSRRVSRHLRASPSPNGWPCFPTESRRRCTDTVTQYRKTMELKENTSVVVLGASGDLAKKKTVRTTSGYGNFGNTPMLTSFSLMQYPALFGLVSN